MVLRNLILIVPLLLALFGCKSDPEAAKQKLLEVANKYYDSGKFKEASIIYRRAIGEDRRFGEAYYRLGLAELKLKRFAGALGALTRAAELEPESEEIYASLADLYLTIYFADRGRTQRWLSEINLVTERAERHFPDSYDVNRIKGYVALAQRDFETAVARLRVAASVKPDDGRVMLGLVQALDGLGDFDEAERLVMTFIERNKSYGPIYDFLYSRYFGRNRRADALAILKAKCESNPSQIAYWIQLARHYYVTEDHQNMMAVAERLLNDQQQYPDAFRYVGDLFMRIREFDDALEVYAKGADALPDRRNDFRNRMVEALALRGEREEAFQLVEQVLEEDSDNAVAQALRGSLRLSSGDEGELQAAIADFQAVLARMPDNVVLRFRLAQAYAASRNLDRAIVEYQEAIKRRPDYMPARYGLTRVHMLNRDHAKAVAAAEEVLSARPNDPTARLLRAAAWIDLGEKRQARSALENLLEEAPDAALPMYYLARLNSIEEDYGEAERLYSRLSEKDPRDTKSFLGLVEAHLAQGQQDQAYQLIQARINEDPDDLQWRRAMALAAIKARDAERAIRELELILSKEPDDEMANGQLGGIYYEKQQIEQAQKYLRRAMELNPDNPFTHLYVGLIMEREGRLQEAVACYERVLELTPDNLIAMNNLAYILSETTADLDRALTLVQRARSRVPEDPNIADTLSWIYIKKNLNDSAILILDELLSKHPDQVTWRYHLATALFQKGDLDRARRELETALRNDPTEDEKGKIRKLLASVNL